MIKWKKKRPIGRYISQIYRKGNSFISKEISKFGIGSGQIMFLMQLYKKRWYQSRGTS